MSALDKLRDWAAMSDKRSFSLAYRAGWWHLSARDRNFKPTRYCCGQSENLEHFCDEILRTMIDG